jgi:Cu(I)/Ag(I) efflux system membrane fusion protein
MQRAFQGKSRRLAVTMLSLFAFVLFVGTAVALADSDTGAKKGCDPKACTKACPLIKTSAQAKTQAAEPDSAHFTNFSDLTMVEGYTCPMHPQVKSEQPGKCAECGMKLVKADFYQVYTCNVKDCPHPCIHAQPGKCCGQELQKTLMTKDEVYQTAGLTDEYFCPMHPEVISAEAGKCPKCGMNLELRTVQRAPAPNSAGLSYVCPMHPDQMSDKPGKCSICGMPLKQVGAAGEDKGSAH